MNFTRVLRPNDYNLFEGHKEIEKLMPKLNSQYRYEHPHRKWEYGLALDFLKESGVKTVLEVGGGGSILAPVLAMNGFDVTETDISNGGETVAQQNQILGTNIKFVLADFSESFESLETKFEEFAMFDAVLCVSTIEHVPNHVDMFRNLCLFAEKAVFLTTDFHPSAETFSTAHLRTYNKESLEEYKKIAEGFDYNVDWGDLEYRGNFVYDYTFASLAMRRR